MKRLIPAFLCLVLILGVFAVRAEAGDPQPFFIHFVVLPAASDDDPRVLEFKKMALALAGGFTELGATSGGSMHKDGVHQEDNLSFIVGAEKDITKDLKMLTKSLFGGKGAFIMSWPGKVMF